ncbi:MAG TPA: Kae1-associated serine/threonine protein kinase [Thermoplasmatales archaeon]|nr:Kae1-associated serine/threonine protein kinase [Thermoplasmatales archaeon]
MNRVIYRGAEAEIILSSWFGREVVKKRRIPKGYRLSEIDRKLRSHRTKEEAKLMFEARRSGVPVPIIYDVHLEESTITMEYLKGRRVKELIPELSDRKRHSLCYSIGENVAKLHNHDIIHGDITTSNMVFVDGRVHFIDFGLGEINREVEAKGVDLHVLMEAFSSAHSRYPECFDYVFEGYEDTFNGDVKEVKKKIDDIIKRGRYQ